MNKKPAQNRYVLLTEALKNVNIYLMFNDHDHEPHR